MQDLPFWKAVLLTIAIIACALVYMFFTSLFGLKDPWIAFVALTIWGAIGMKMEQAPGIFLGGILGLTISLSIEVFPDLFGPASVVLPLTFIILAVACKIKEWLPILCNFGLFMFLTVGSAEIVSDQRLQLLYMKDLAFAALCFWIMPRIFLKFRSRNATDG